MSYSQPSYSGVYKITCTETNKCYVGSSINVVARTKRHMDDLKYKTHHAVYMQRSYDKYGADKFRHETLIVCRPEDVLLYEQAAIDALKPEFNVAPTAGTPGARDEAFRKNMRAKLTAVWACPERRKAASVRAKAQDKWALSSEERLKMWEDPAYREKQLSRWKNYTLFGVTDSLKGLAKLHGVSYSMVKSRVHAGWDVERAITTPKRKGGL